MAEVDRYSIPARMKLNPTCIILGERKGQLRPTHIIPVTVVLGEVDLKPRGRQDIAL